MPLQNRVLPTGEIVAHPGRGMIMGNRGCIHQLDRTLGVTRWRTKMWISCVLDWNGRRRDVMPPGRWTALFFLDEATALAAGHRPCGFCRRDDHVWFGESWRAGAGLRKRLKASEMDIVLHSERVESRTRRKITRTVQAGSLPDGVMIAYDDTIGLWYDGALLPWTFDGYQEPLSISSGSTVSLLTPPSIVAAIKGGYRPMVHPTANATSLRQH